MHDVSFLEPGFWVGEAGAAGHRDSAEPLFVGCGAVGAGSSEGVLAGGGDVAGDLLQGEIEELVGGLGAVVVPGGEGGGAVEGFRVAWDGVGDLVAEG